jgi:hypothetical protein
MPRLAEHSVSQTRMQARRHDQVDVTTEDLLEPISETDVSDEPRHHFKLHEQVHVAFWPGITPRNRPEQFE